MTLVLETGFGVQDANSYINRTFVDNYLSARNRSTENSWSTQSDTIKDAHCIAATQYIDDRFGNRFKGSRLTFFDGAQAKARIEFTGQPANDEALVLGDYTYTFKTALSTLGSFEVLIGTDFDATAANLLNAINQGEGSGTTRSEDIIQNQHATGVENADDPSIIDLTASQEGEAGNDIALTTTAGNITLTVFVNGRDQGSQPLEFPRSALYNRDGILVAGIPRKLKEAAAEYAVRSLGSTLAPDPTVDASGKTVTKTKEKVGPIETEKEFSEGGALEFQFKPYPAADAMLREYVRPSGRVYR